MSSATVLAWAIRVDKEAKPLGQNLTTGPRPVRILIAQAQACIRSTSLQCCLRRCVWGEAQSLDYRDIPGAGCYFMRGLIATQLHYIEAHLGGYSQDARWRFVYKHS